MRVDLCTVRDETAAYIDSNLGGELPDHTDSSYMALQVNGPWFTKSRIQPGYVHIRIDTDGDDTWDFSFTLYLKYSDGSTTSVDAPPSTEPRPFFELSDEVFGDFKYRIAYIRTRNGDGFWYGDSI